jgi:hypothetical protein
MLEFSESEDGLTREVVRLLNMHEDFGKLRGVWFHVPNESVIKTKKDLKLVAKKLAHGMKAGAPDLVFLKPGGCLQIELKIKQGRMSESQKFWRDLSQKRDVPYVVARSWGEVARALENHGFLDKPL